MAQEDEAAHGSLKCWMMAYFGDKDTGDSKRSSNFSIEHSAARAAIYCMIHGCWR